MELISIIIPCRNEKDFICRCLDSVLAFNSPHDGFEIFIVDGMSEDGTREIIQNKYCKDKRVSLFDNPNLTTPYALNTGIKFAHGEFIAIAGVHAEFPRDYLVRCIEVMNNTKADNVGGPCIAMGKTLMQKAIALAFRSSFAVGNARWHFENYEGEVDTIFPGFYRRSKLIEIGLFDEEFTRNQDDELNLRLIRSGGKIWQSPRIKSWYYPRDSLKKLFTQYMQYGYWKVRVIQKHKIPASWRHLVPGFFVFAILLGIILGIFSSLFAKLWILGASLYLFINLFVSIHTSYKNNWRLLPLLPVVFFIYHFSYGYGFLRGIWDFIIRKKTKASTKFQTLSR